MTLHTVVSFDVIIDSVVADTIVAAVSAKLSNWNSCIFLDTLRCTEAVQEAMLIVSRDL